jgi:hypothetical protein
MAKSTSTTIVVRDIGLRGVNVDKNPLELANNELTRAANAVPDSASVRNRPGLVAFSTTATAGTVLGGVDLPLADRLTGTRFLYIGREPT